MYVSKNEGQENLMCVKTEESDRRMGRWGEDKTENDSQDKWQQMGL